MSGPARRAAGIATVAAIAVMLGACTDGVEPTGPETAPAAAVRITVAEEGLYRVALGDLRRGAIGWDDVDPYGLRLTHRGKTVPLWRLGRPEPISVAFYGRPPDGRYAPENAYLLWRDAGPAASPDPRDSFPSFPPHEPATVGRFTERREENARYVPQRTDGDPWLLSRIGAGGEETFEVAIEDPEPWQAELAVALWSGTDAPADPDHHVRIAVNGSPLHDARWDGAGSRVLTTTVPAGLLRDGRNDVTIQIPGDTGAPAEIVDVDWLEVRYFGRLVLRDQSLTARCGSGYHRLGGLSGPIVLVDAGDPEAPLRLSVMNEDWFACPPAGGPILAATERGLRKPIALERAALLPDLRNEDAGAEWLAIGPPDLLEAATPLLDAHVERGLRVRAVPLQAVVDQFGDGIVEPEAVRAFLRHAVGTWKVRPTHVLLVGDATYDPQGHVAPPEANRVPTFLVPTASGGETASDAEIANLDADPWPDVSLARLPARTPDEVATIVRKTLAYLALADGGSDAPWRHRALAVVDPLESLSGPTARTFLDALPEALDTELLTPATGDPTAAGQLRARLDEGALVVGYFGHGAIDRWGKDGLLTNAEAEALANAERLPVVANFTCLTGLFSHVERTSMAEALLLHPEGGAAAVLAPTSLTYGADQLFLAEKFAEAWRSPTTLGEAVLSAWRAADPEDEGQLDVMRTFLLFGDPALPLVPPPDRGP